MQRLSNPTIATYLSAKERYVKRMEQFERARSEAMFVNPYTDGRVPLGHEHIVQIKSNY